MTVLSFNSRVGQRPFGSLELRSSYPTRFQKKQATSPLLPRALPSRKPVSPPPSSYGQFPEQRKPRQTLTFHFIEVLLSYLVQETLKNFQRDRTKGNFVFSEQPLIELKENPMNQTSTLQGLKATNFLRRRKGCRPRTSERKYLKRAGGIKFQFRGSKNLTRERKSLPENLAGNR